MNSIKKRLIQMNTHTFNRIKTIQSCNRWIKQTLTLTTDISQVSNHFMNVSGQSSYYNLAYEYVVGQIDLLDDRPVTYFVVKGLVRANNFYDRGDYCHAYLELYKTSQLVRKLVKKSPVEMETWLTIQLLQKRIAGKLFQLDTEDSWNICGMYFATDPSAKTWGHLSKTGQARNIVTLMNVSFNKDSPDYRREVTNQRDMLFINPLISNFLYEEDLLPHDVNLAPGLNRLATITNPLQKQDVLNFIKEYISDTTFAKFITHVVLEALDNTKVPEPYKNVRGMLFLMKVFSPENMRYCERSSADKDDDFTTRIVYYFHTVFLMIDLLSHHFGRHDKAPEHVSKGYYDLMKYLHLHRFGIYKNE